MYWNRLGLDTISVVGNDAKPVPPSEIRIVPSVLTLSTIATCPYAAFAVHVVTRCPGATTMMAPT